MRLLWGGAEVGGRECRGDEGGEPSLTPLRAAPKPHQVLIKAGLVKMHQRQSAFIPVLCGLTYLGFMGEREGLDGGLCSSLACLEGRAQ